MTRRDDTVRALLPRSMAPRLARTEAMVQRANAALGGAPLSRREALGLGGLGLLLAACGGQTAAVQETSETTPAAGSDSGASSATTSTSSLAGKPIEGQLNVYDWTEYEDPKSIEAFTKATSVKLEHSFYSDNGEMIAKLNAGGAYDVIVPSQNAVAQLIETGQLMELDPALVPNATNIDAAWQDVSYDPGTKYSKVHSYGVSGFLWRSDVVDDTPTTFLDALRLFPKYGKLGRTNLLQGAEGIVPWALIALGYDCNAPTPDQLEEARRLMLEIRPGVTTISSENINADYAAGKIIFGTCWNGQAVLAIDARREQGKDDLVWLAPEGPGERWADNWAITANAKNPVAAHAWINHFLDPKIVAETIAFSGYGTPMTAAFDLLDPAMKANPVLNLNPDTVANYAFILNPSPQVVNDRQRLYTEFKAA